MIIGMKGAASLRARAGLESVVPQGWYNETGASSNDRLNWLVMSGWLQERAVQEQEGRSGCVPRAQVKSPCDGSEMISEL